MMVFGMHIPGWIDGAAGALVASAAVRALPAPKPLGNAFYEWFYNFTQYLLANFDKPTNNPPKVIVP